MTRYSKGLLTGFVLVIVSAFTATASAASSPLTYQKSFARVEAAIAQDPPNVMLWTNLMKWHPPSMQFINDVLILAENHAQTWETGSVERRLVRLAHSVSTSAQASRDYADTSLRDVVEYRLRRLLESASGWEARRQLSRALLNLNMWQAAEYGYLIDELRAGRFREVASPLLSLYHLSNPEQKEKLVRALRSYRQADETRVFGLSMLYLDERLSLEGLTDFIERLIAHNGRLPFHSRLAYKFFDMKYDPGARGIWEKHMHEVFSKLSADPRLDTLLNANPSLAAKQTTIDLRRYLSEQIETCEDLMGRPKPKS